MEKLWMPALQPCCWGTAVGEQVRASWQLQGCASTSGAGHPGSQLGLSHSCGSRQPLSALSDTPKAAPAQTQQGGKGKASLLALSQPEALSPERRQALERYLQLRR